MPINQKWKCLFKFSSHFPVILFFYFVVCVLSILWILTPCQIYDLTISYSVKYVVTLFCFVDSFLHLSKSFLVWCSLLHFCFYWRDRFLKMLLRSMSKTWLLMLSSKSFMVSVFTFTSLIHHELIFVVVYDNGPDSLFAYSCPVFQH